MIKLVHQSKLTGNIRTVYFQKTLKKSTFANLITALLAFLLSACASMQPVDPKMSAEQIAEMTLQAILPPTNPPTNTPPPTNPSNNTLLATFTPFQNLDATPIPTLTPINYRPTSTALASCVPLIDFNFGTVTRVLEGDTVEVSIDGVLHLVRYIGVDSPANGRLVEPWGPEARDQNAAIVENKFVRLVKEISDHDREDYLLRYVFVGDRLVNYEVVRNGYALAISMPPNTACDTLFRQAEEQARAEEIGLWASKISACDVSQDPTYAFTMENPIQIGGLDIQGPSRETQYLDNLRGPSGQQVTYQRTASFYFDGHILDAFEVFHPELTGPITIYFDVHRFEPLFAPVSFICAGPIPIQAP